MCKVYCEYFFSLSLWIFNLNRNLRLLPDAKHHFLHSYINYNGTSFM